MQFGWLTLGLSPSSDGDYLAIHEQVAQACEVVSNDTRDALDRAELLRRCRDAEALIAFMPERIDEAFVAACPRLRIVACALKGFDNFDVEACTRHAVWLTIVPDLLQAPPLPSRASASDVGAPSGSDTFISLPRAKKPSDSLSGAKNGCRAPSVPARTTGSPDRRSRPRG